MGKLIAVRGVTDSPELLKIFPDREAIKVEHVKIGIIYKGQPKSENTDGLRSLAKKTDVDVLIFEHFHHRIAIRPKYSCATVPGIAEPSAIELEITERNLKGQIIRCSGNVCSYFEYEKP